jgi:hypothetical protein
MGTSLQTDQVDRHGIGGNSPPDPMDPVSIRLRLTESEAALTKRRDDLLAGVARFEVAFPAIDNDEDQARAGDFMKQIQQAIKVANDRFKPAKQPYLEGGRIVDTFFKGIREPLEAGLDRVRRPMTVYAQEQERIRREVARRVAEEAAARARQIAEEAAAAQQAEADRLEAARAGEYVPPPPVDVTPATLDDAIEAANAAASAARAAEARPAEFSRTRGDMGAVSSLREIVTVELVDLAQVPLEFLAFNESAARKAAQAGRADIPGVRIVRTNHIQTR